MENRITILLDYNFSVIKLIYELIMIFNFNVDWLIN